MSEKTRTAGVETVVVFSRVLDYSPLSPQPQSHYIPVQYLLSPRSSIALFLIVIVCHILTEHFTLQKQKFYVCKILRSCDVMMLDLNKQ